MQTQCISEQLRFEGFDGRRVEAAFDGGAVTSDAGALLLRETDRAISLIDRVAGCFRDGRDPGRVVHPLRTLVGQRLIGLALGYEDVNDHDDLRFDPVLALFADRLEPRRADCAALGGKSTLNRLEHAPRAADDRYRKIAVDERAVENLLVDLFVDAHARAPKEIVLDLDATDDPLHGHQEGRFFHGYYDCYCYLPLYVFCGRHLLAAKLRRSNIDAADGAVDEVARIVARIRARWPRVRIVLRADSGFAREALMGWCETHRVYYVFGLARNSRLIDELAIDMAWAEDEHEKTGKPARRFHDFRYRTLDSWSRRRRVIGKAEHLAKGANPRFVVTPETPGDRRPDPLRTGLLRARRHGEPDQGTAAGPVRRSDLTATMAANQLRLWFSSFAYVLMAALRRLALQHTEFETATCGTIRLKLLKIGARVTVSVRRIKIRHGLGLPIPGGLRHGARPPARPAGLSRLLSKSKPWNGRRRGAPAGGRHPRRSHRNATHAPKPPAKRSRRPRANTQQLLNPVDRPQESSPWWRYPGPRTIELVVAAVKGGELDEQIRKAPLGAQAAQSKILSAQRKGNAPLPKDCAGRPYEHINTGFIS